MIWSMRAAVDGNDGMARVVEAIDILSSPITVQMVLHGAVGLTWRRDMLGMK